MADDRQPWAWRQQLPADEKLLLLALTASAATDAETLGRITGLGGVVTDRLLNRLQSRGLIDADRNLLDEGEDDA